MNDILQRLQREHGPWELKNFGKQPAYRPLLGIIEELGELQDATTEADIKDCLADTVVFMAHFCNEMGYKLDDLARAASTYQVSTRGEPSSWIVRELGIFAHHFLKLEQGIRGTEAEHRIDIMNCLVRIYAILLDTAKKHGIDLLEAVDFTWTRVKKRDWTKDTRHGGEVHE